MQPKDKQLAFLLITITVLGCVVFYLYLTTKGIDVSRYQVVKVSNIKPEPVSAPKLTVTSVAFKNDEVIPDKYTCKGTDVNPPLTIGTVPANTKSLVLFIEDPDATYKTWTHWIVVNIPVQVSNTKNPDVVIAENSIPKSAVLGQNDWGKGEYSGPCPPVGEHRYVFKVYALDNVLEVSGGEEKSKILKLMENHILGYGELIGRFSK